MRRSPPRQLLPPPPPTTRLSAFPYLLNIFYCDTFVRVSLPPEGRLHKDLPWHIFVIRCDLSLPSVFDRCAVSLCIYLCFMPVLEYGFYFRFLLCFIVDVINCAAFEAGLCKQLHIVLSVHGITARLSNNRVCVPYPVRTTRGE